MAQEVQGYVEAVMNNLAANVPKAVVLCQVEKVKEDMLNQLYSSISEQSSAKIEEFLRVDGNVKQKRERCQKQQSSLSKLVKLLSIHDNWSSTAASSWSDSIAGTESSPRIGDRTQVMMGGQHSMLLQMDPLVHQDLASASIQMGT